ncbi:F0F1 ATP synthase subunit epsilon [Desulfovibrio sp. OttesenSCG-928-I05]|nr:F0F1 ATP synthase subunit epsilon [Desulfovibrio sp. OttesenSCG-928-I05]
MDMLRLEIVTPDNTVLETEADFVSVPGLEGIFGVLPGHIPFLSALATGCLHYTKGGETRYVCLSGGFAEVSGNTVRILADSAEKLEDIDTERAEKAKERAMERLRKAAQEDTINAARAEAALRRAMNRLNTKSAMR